MYGSFRRGLDLLRLPTDLPDTYVVQFKTIVKQAPLFYGMLWLNTSLTIYVHRDVAPVWLTLGPFCMMTIMCLARGLAYHAIRDRIFSSEEAFTRLQVMTTFVRWAMIGIALWSFLLAQYGDESQRLQVLCSVIIVVLSSIFGLLHIPTTALNAILPFAPVSFFFLFAGNEAIQAVALGFLVLCCVLTTLIFVYYDIFLSRVVEHREMRRLDDDNLRLANTDLLTALPNRRTFFDRLEAELAGARREDARLHLCFLDLDRFKSVNDTYGHGVGDLLLIQVARRLTEMAGPDGFVSRLGGDEMAFLVHGDLDQATGVAQKVLETLAFPFRVDEITVNIGCSIGMCCIDKARNAVELMQFADIALYESKRGGRGRLSCYSRGMMEAVSERIQIETDMRTAIQRGEMHLAYQPVLALIDDQIVGYEALIRWSHPTLGAISPVRFIPLAEETGQIVEIGAWVLQEACQQAASLPDDVYVAVNVSAVQFRSPLLLSHLTKALAMSGLPARRLEIELTETAIVEDGARIAQMLSAIRHLGVSIAMDDFGTGYSSLAHLRDFPLDRIKIDRSFVSTAETDRHSMAVLEGVTQIARKLDIAIQAEGVETNSQLELLRSIGCDAVQGYLIGRPERLPFQSDHHRNIRMSA